MNGIVAGMPEQDYHARTELSSTGARLLLDSPARFKYRMAHPFHSEAFDLGTAVHARVLGVGPQIEALEFTDYRSKAAQQARDEARASGKVPMLWSQQEQVRAMTEAVLAHPTARALLEVDGIPEASVFGTDPDTGVDMRARFDFLPTAGKAVDLKTTAGSASSDGFAKSAAAYRYDVQEAHYLETLRFATEITFDMAFIVVEKDAPHFVAVHQLDDQFALIGQDDARRAREIYAQCLDTDQWPGYPNEIIQTSPPAWLVYRHQDKYDQEIEVA